MKKPTIPGLAARLAGLGLLGGVLTRQGSLQDLALHVPAKLPAQDKARAQSLAESVLRHLSRADGVLQGFLQKPPPALVHNILRIAATEMLAEGIPAHAAVDGAVLMAKASPKSASFAGLINAVSRKVAVQGPDLWAAQPSPLMPDWLRQPVVAAWGEPAAQAIEAAHERGAALDLTLRDPASATHWLAQLRQAGQDATLLPTGSLRLNRPAQVTSLPGYAEGAWWVQDTAASLPARLLGNLQGARVLDLCAAPGGKTMQLAAAGGQVTALDISGPRLKRLEANLKRTGLAARLVTADAAHWQPDGRYDAILLDAPCTASGTIRRHPDLPFVHDGSDLADLTALQSTLLDRALTWLAPGGRLVCCTCSLLRAEGEDQVAGRNILPITPLPGMDPGWITPQGTLRLRPDFWPERGGIDGFFASVLSS